MTAETRPEWEIYVLLDPREGQIRYVGQSADAHERMIQHQSGMSEATRNWVEMLAGVGLRPVLKVVARATNRQEAYRVEKRWVEGLRASGLKLLNVDRKVVAIRAR